jgi:hemolysin activation/secretion protein
VVSYSLLIPSYAGAQSQDEALKAVMEKVEALQKRVDQLEKKVAEQERIIQLQKEALEKVAEIVPEVKVVLRAPQPKILVKKFVLNGVNLFTPKDFEPLLSKYRNKELTMDELKKIADEITAFYRSKGYISSLAYLPAQEIENNTVEFRVVEGRVGDIKVEGGKYYKAEKIKRLVHTEKGQVLNYERLQQDIRRINQQPDRTMKAVLVPGKEQGLTDILIKMEKEEKPYHFYLDYNNRGTQYTTKNRYGVGFVHNNLTGNEDILSLRARIGEDSDVYAGSIDYNFPINRYNTRLGLYAAYSHADIGEQFKVLSPEGKATAYGIYITHPLFDKDFFDPVALNMKGTITAGLDAISVYNKILGKETSHDELRVAKLGLSLDEKDAMGRTFLTQELRFGIPDFLGSMDENDTSASRLDAGGEFTKYVGTITRVNRLPFSSLLLASFKYQFTDEPLVNSEQMSFGGADSIRGYPENDYLGDYGWITRLELRTPAFIFPREIKVPYDKKGTSLMDAIQFVYFVDFGKAYLKKPRAGEKKDRLFTSVGFGLRLELYGHLKGMVDIGFPVGNEEPSDGSDNTVHVGVQYEF